MIKTFEFEVSNTASFPLKGDDQYSWYNEDIANLRHPDDIDDCINAWIEEKHPIIEDIKIVPVEVHYHNNARGNTVRLFYTIIYR